MIEQINSMFVSIHKLLFPMKDILFYGAFTFSIIVLFYYEFMNPKKLIQKKRIRNAFLFTGLAITMLSYSVLLNYQEPEFLTSLYIFIPLCTILPTVVLVGCMWIAFNLNLKSIRGNRA